MKPNQEQTTIYNRPFISQRADPYLYRGPDGMYYFTASVPAYDRIVLRRASSIRELPQAEEKTLWVKHDSGPMSLHIWAPELHRLDGGWYIYFAASETTSRWKLRPYVLHCMGTDPMEDPWEELGMMQSAEGDRFSFRDFSLDATVFSHRSEHYFVWAEKVNKGKKISNLYIARMSGPTRLATSQVLLSSPDYDWERVGFWVNEGPAFLEHDGRIFLTYSASETGECYCMGMLSISSDADLLDPGAWKKERLPVLCSDAEKGIYGPGHNSFVKAEDGRTDLCIFHARPYPRIKGNPLYDPNRHALLMEIKYDKTGYPVFEYCPQLF
ncbi:MAG: family 43 glycosylhydrolase [Oscillospiraceae bacterium]|nr:family 43 glycosylhydrolase [Oscillospiraceae bacterium]